VNLYGSFTQNMQEHLPLEQVAMSRSVLVEIFRLR
jgi:hypothetical protein